MTTSPSQEPRPSGRYRLRGIVLSVLSAAVLGVVAVVVAGLLNPNALEYDAPLFPLVRRGVEGFGSRSLVLLAVAGCVVSVFRAAPAILIGLATLAAFPVITVAEIVVDPTSHNLFPIEWFIYGLETVPGILGAYLGLGLRETITELTKVGHQGGA